MSDHPLEDFRPPKAPPELRRRTLTAARAALESSQRPATRFDRWIDRWWTNRPLRMAWAAAVLFLLAINVLLSVAAPVAGDGGTQTEHLAHQVSVDASVLPPSPALERLVEEAGSGWADWADSRDLLRDLDTQETF